MAKTEILLFYADDNIFHFYNIYIVLVYRRFLPPTVCL